MIVVSRLPNVRISILPARVLLGAVPLVTVELFSEAVAMRITGTFDTT